MDAAGTLGHLDRLGFGALRLLLSALWQSSLLIAAIAVVALLLRRRRAAVRHAVWVAALVLTPALPLLSWAAARAGTPQAAVRVVSAYPLPAPLAEREAAPPAAALPTAPTAQLGARLPAGPVRVGCKTRVGPDADRLPLCARVRGLRPRRSRHALAGGVGADAAVAVAAKGNDPRRPGGR